MWDEGWRAGSYCGINGETQFGPRLRISQVAQMYVVFALVGKVAVLGGISPKTQPAVSKGKAVPNIFRVFIFNLQSFSMSSAYGNVSDPHIWHREFFDLFAHGPRKSKQYHLILNPFEGDKRLQINRPGQGLWMEMRKRFPTPIG